MVFEDLSCPASHMTLPVFIDTEGLADLNQLKQHVQRSYNLVLLLTPGVLTRPWCLVEIVVAHFTGVNIVPVEVQRPGANFVYPDEGFYKRLLRSGESSSVSQGDDNEGPLLRKDAVQVLASEGIDLHQIVTAVTQVFKKIALPFSPHKSSNIRQAELQNILKRCLAGYDGKQTQNVSPKSRQTCATDSAPKNNSRTSVSITEMAKDTLGTIFRPSQRTSQKRGSA
mmetsp:Transcript_19779/g.37078  ORF Transcript_19779/g.37078 Transcript_19779/m.37078 type:complete len:226 (+) Transcript_19779:3-680(+)